MAHSSGYSGHLNPKRITTTKSTLLPVKNVLRQHTIAMGLSPNRCFSLKSYSLNLWIWLPEVLKISKGQTFLNSHFYLLMMKLLTQQLFNPKRIFMPKWGFKIHNIYSANVERIWLETLSNPEFTSYKTRVEVLYYALEIVIWMHPFSSSSYSLHR